MGRLNMVLLTSFYLILTSNVIAQFKESSTELGINHIHKTPTLMGGGVTYLDFNNDGFLDIYLTGATDADRLYLNLDNESYYDVSEQTGISSLTKDKYTFGVISGDINNDGCEDLFISTYSANEASILLLNNCDGTFKDISRSANIDDQISSSGAAFIDADKDGFLDIYVINYIDQFIFIKDENDIIVDIDRTCLPNLLYINQKNNFFINRATDYGVDNIGCGLAVMSTDFDFDGDQDLHVINDHGIHVVPNAFYQNNYPEKSFTDISLDNGLDIPIYGMGVAAGDVDDDGTYDYYISNLGNNAFMKATDSQYTDEAERLGMTNGFYEDSTSVSAWGTFFFDYDNDSDLDLFISNGYIRTGYFGFITTRTDQNKLYENIGDGDFKDVTDLYNLADDQVGRGTSYADFNGDGKLDFIVVNAHEEEIGNSLIYINEFNNNNNWASIKLEAIEGTNRNAFGSYVTIHLGERRIIRELTSGGSHASQHSQIIHFGLGEKQIIDSMVVSWPSELDQTFYEVAVNQSFYLLEGSEDLLVQGCMDENSSNYNELATYNSGCLSVNSFGCTDLTAINYSSEAKVNDGSCEYFTDEIITAKKIAEEAKPVLFPNPASESIKIKSVNSDQDQPLFIKVINTLGQVVMSEEFVFSENQNKINIENLPEGVYVLELVDGTGDVVFTSRFVK